MREVYVVTEGQMPGRRNAARSADINGIFTTEVAAQAWVERQQARGYPWELVVERWPADDAVEDLPVYKRPGPAGI